MRRYLLEELRHLTHQAGVALHLAFVSVRQEEVTQQWSVCQCLDDAVHEARVAQVYQTTQAWEWSREEKLKTKKKKNSRQNRTGKERETGRNKEKREDREKELKRARSFFLAAAVGQISCNAVNDRHTHTHKHTHIHTQCSTMMSLRQRWAAHRETLQITAETATHTHTHRHGGGEEEEKPGWTVGKNRRMQRPERKRGKMEVEFSHMSSRASNFPHLL